MKNITFSAHETLIGDARWIAASRNTTLNTDLRLLLADYVGRQRQTEKAMAALDAVAQVANIAGRKFTRDEMNERRAFIGHEHTGLCVRRDRCGQAAAG